MGPKAIPDRKIWNPLDYEQSINNPLALPLAFLSEHPSWRPGGKETEDAPGGFRLRGLFRRTRPDEGCQLEDAPKPLLSTICHAALEETNEKNMVQTVQTRAKKKTNIWFCWGSISWVYVDRAGHFYGHVLYDCIIIWLHNMIQVTHVMKCI